jgi:fatty acid desaturase
MRKKILRRVGIQVEPKHVERASRRERWRRQLWMFASTVIAFGSVLAALSLLAWLVPPFPPTGVIGTVTAVVAMSIAAALDLQLFGWGLERFDLVVPWQFRDEAKKENDV